MVSTGIKGLDTVINNLRLGDNVVWQVDDLKSYLHVVRPYIKQSLQDKRKVIYIRFGKHPALIKNEPRVKTYQINAAAGFESFSKQIHDIITREGVGAFYLFDCLSELQEAWATDLMIGNFFMVTCPYLFKLDTIAYFAILRDRHSYKTVARIRETTQLLLDLCQVENHYYLQPLKVWNRYSPTMFLPHAEERQKFVPLTNSVDAARLLAFLSSRGGKSARRNLDYWDLLFLQAQETSRGSDKKKKRMMIERLSEIMLAKEGRMLALVKENFSLEDLLAVKERMIGTGYIGGKAVGMLVARKILSRDKTDDWESRLEPHDSFFIGSDVFYTYIVENGWWELWLEQKTSAGYFSKAVELREKMLSGVFPHEIKEQFRQLIEYFGQSPIIIRSSSLLEDAFGNAFAGKYESIFDVNQGSPDERCQRLENIIRQVFASTLNDDALAYRLQRGLSQHDEQMALLIQRVSGRQQGDYFFPAIGGVGISYNTFVWHKEMKPEAGMLRLVLGLGTRAVNRVEGDYPRIVALDAPLLRPYANLERVKKFSQHEVDLLNISANEMQTLSLEKLLTDVPGLDLSLFGQRDPEAEQKLKELGFIGEAWVLTFDPLLAETGFAATMRRLIKTLETNYHYPVDVEFTVNFTADGQARINLVQCRPLQTRGETSQVTIPADLAPEQVVFSSTANFMGGSVSLLIDRVILVDPEEYGNVLMSKKFELARFIGKLNKQSGEGMKTLLIGPGRWGTRDPSLGVPVNFAEINNISALVEVDDPAGGFMPELSFGSHFFLDLVETNIFYVALFMDDPAVTYNRLWLSGLPNKLAEVLPEAAQYEKVLRVYDFPSGNLTLLSDITAQKVVCFKGRG